LFGDYGLLRRARRPLGLLLSGDRPLRRCSGRDERCVGDTIEDALDSNLHLLADELRRVGDTNVVAVELADSRVDVVETDLAELDPRLPPFLDRRLDGKIVALAFHEDAEVIEMHSFLADEEEAPARLRLELGEPLRARTDQQRGDACGNLDAVRLGARTGRERAQPALDVECSGSFGDDDAVAPARRTLLCHYLAWAVRDVLPGHLDEAERRNLDDVCLRPVAPELGPQRFLDGRAVLRIRHVDEVDDDDPADVTETQL